MKQEDNRSDLFFKELKKCLKKYPSTLAEWKQICEDFNNKKEGSYGYKIRKRMDDMIAFNNAIPMLGNFSGWRDIYDAYDDMYNCFFEELNNIYRDLEDKYLICTDPIWLWDNDDRSTHFKLSFVNDSIIPNKDVRIVVYFGSGYGCIGKPNKIDLTVDDKSVLKSSRKKKLT